MPPARSPDVTQGMRPEAAAPHAVDLDLTPSLDLVGELIAMAVRTGALLSPGNAGPIPTFPGNSQADSHRIPTVPCSTAQPVPPRSTHERH